MRINSPTAFIVRIENSVAISFFGGTEFLLIAKINVTSYREEKLLSQVANEIANMFFVLPSIADAK